MRSESLREVVIVGAVRTAIGRGHPEKGVFRDMHPAGLLGRTYVELLSRTGVAGSDVDNVIAGCVQQIGEQSMNVARNAWLQEGLPIETPAETVDTQCGSAQMAVNLGATMIASGVIDVAIGSGVEHMGRIPFTAGERTQAEFGSPWTPEFFDRHDVQGQGIGAELIAEERRIQRRELDELGARSQQRAAKSSRTGKFAREIVGVRTNGSEVSIDQGIRPDTTVETLSQLRPAFRPDGLVTAGTSSQISDGAAAVMLMSAERARELGVEPRARIIDQVVVGCDPVKMLEGPIPATAKILARNGMSIDDIDYLEINEAFAPVVCAWNQEYPVDPAKVNPRGGAIALGHPLGSTGARLLTTLLHELEDDEKSVGLVTMCCGGGVGTGTLIERV